MQRRKFLQLCGIVTATAITPIAAASIAATKKKPHSPDRTIGQDWAIGQDWTIGQNHFRLFDHQKIVLKELRSGAVPLWATTPFSNFWYAATHNDQRARYLNRAQLRHN